MAPPIVDAVTYFHNDIAGTPQLATNASGAVVWKENYLPYGQRQAQTPASAGNKLWYTGKPHEEDTGLTYMGARYYMPLVGRFAGIDPVDIVPGQPHSLNRYAYGNNNPYKFVDPDGRHPILFAAYEAAGFVGTRAVIWLAERQMAAIVAAEAAAAVATGAVVPSVALEGVAATAVKRVPNPFGKAGGPAHQAKAEEVAAGIRARGLEASTEHRVLTPDGCKSCRYVDVVGKNAEGKVVEMHQVGRQTGAGNPVAREARALDDIQKATNTRPEFHPYN